MQFKKESIIDLFILQSEFPSLSKTLNYRIYEQRYIKMIIKALNNKNPAARTFGIISNATAEGGTSKQPALVGTLLTINNYTTDQNKTEYNIQTTASQRFRIISTIQKEQEQDNSANPTRALVQFFQDPLITIPLPSDLIDTTKQAFAKLHNFSTQVITDWQKTLTNSSSSSSKPNQPGRPIIVSFAGRILFSVRSLKELTELNINEYTWRCLGALPLSPAVKLRLLRTISIKERLQYLRNSSTKALSALRAVQERNRSKQVKKKTSKIIIQIPGLNEIRIGDTRRDGDQEEEMID